MHTNPYTTHNRKHLIRTLSSLTAHLYPSNFYGINICMTKFGDRIFNSRKKQPDNKKQDDMTKRPESQEKQMKWPNEESGMEIERYLEQLPKTERLNEIVHAIERRIGRFNAALRAGILAAAMTAGGAAVSERVESQPEQERGYTHEKYIKENEERSIAVLSKFFKNPSRIIRECGGVTDFQKNSEDENAPVLMHIAQNHGSPSYRDAGTYISQWYVRRCLISMIEENNTGKVLPIGFEHSVEKADREEMLKELMLSCLGQLRHSQRDKYMFFDSNNASQEKLNEFPYKLNPQNLSTLSIPLLSILKHFKPEESTNILSLFDIEHRHILDSEIADALLSRLMELLYEIEKEHNVYFEVTDKNVPTAEDPDEYVADYLSLQDDQNFLKMTSIVQKYNDEVIIERDRVAVETSLQLAEKFDTALAVCIFGSSHDFRDDIAGKNANLLRIETAPSNVHNGILTYGITEGFVLDGYYLEYGVPISPEIVLSWDLVGGGREATKDYLLHMRRQYYHFLFRNAHSVQSVLQFSQDEWFSIIRDSIQDRKHLWAHEEYGNIEKFRNYVSAEQFASLKEGVLKCKGHENEKR